MNNQAETEFNEKSEICENTEGVTVLFFRWTVLVILVAFSLRVEKPLFNNFYYITLFFIVMLNTWISAKVIQGKKFKKKTSAQIIYFDIVVISVFLYYLGGIESDLYIFYFFLLGYCGLFTNPESTVKIGLFCVLCYTAVCVNVSPEIEYFKLIVRDILIIIWAYGITRINYQLKFSMKSHKNEFILARTDYLTGLANRHYLDIKLKEDVSYTDRNKGSLCIMMFDIDNFKIYNDFYGHMAGDNLLKIFADVISANVRKSDTAVRYGGEEFIIILKDADACMAEKIAERIRKQFEKKGIKMSEEGEGIMTVSCGIAQYPLHSNDIDQTIYLADKALYVSKKTGKNKSKVFNREELNII